MQILHGKKSKQTTFAFVKTGRSRLLLALFILATLFAAALAHTQLASTSIKPAPRLSAAVSGGQMQLHISNLQSNQVYEIEASTNLINWTGISQRSTVSGTLTFTDPQAGKFSRRYYRAVAPADLTGLGQDGYAPGKILVKPLPGVSLGGLNLSLGVSVLNVFPAIGNLQVVKVPPTMTASTLITLYQQSGLVQYAEHDFYVQALTEPSDPHYVNGDLWNMNNVGQYGGTPGADIRATNAWSTMTDASSVTVAVVDTGVRYTHEDLAANMWGNPADGSHGTNVVAGNTDPNDDYGHGTHVAGIIGAVGNNGVGVAGVCWQVRIMACKFLDSTGNGTIDGAIACMDYARTHGVKVVNASWGAPSFTSQALHDAIASLRDAGIILVAAAGNSGADNDTTPLYPASYSSDLDNVVAVAATDRNDGLASFSDYGATNVDLAAPGTPIMSCWDGSDSDYQDDDGTSMSCAHVAGACALLWAYFPNDTYRQIIQRIYNGTDPLPGLTGKCVTGGRLDVAKALGGGTPPPPALTANFTASPSSGPAPLAVQFTDTSTGGPVSWNWNFGDGATSTVQNPSHTFNNDGSFTTTLTVTGSSGQTSSTSRTITATTNTTSSLPVITLEATQPDAYASGQVPGTVTFHRTGDTSQAYEVYWTFSGTAANGVDYGLNGGPYPTNSPFPAGQSDAPLTITPIDHGQTNDETVIVTLASGPDYQAGTPDSATIIIHGHQPSSGPVAGFTATPTSGQAPLTVQFTDTSTGSPTNWEWNFGDGAASTAQNPSHIYSNSGSFTATLTVTGSGQTSSASRTITVTNSTTPPPTVTADFVYGPASGQAPLTVQFTDKSTGSIAGWNWNFGDGSANSTEQNPSHTYSVAGNFAATLTVTGTDGSTSSKSQSVTVTNAAQSVTASFSAKPSSGQAPLTVQFTDQSSGPVSSWSWNFGDGSSSSTAQNPSHTYSGVGSFTATLTVTGSGGQTSSASHTITVTNASAQPDINILGQFDQRTGTGVSIPSGDMTPSTADGTDYGSVTVSNGVAGRTFAIQNTGNATLAITLPITLSGPNAADFTVTQPPATNLAAGATMQFEISFAPSATGLRSATVNIGNSVPDKNPYTFAIQGTGTNASVQPVNAAFAANPSSGQAPLAVNFTDQSSGPVNSWSWNFGDGATSTAQNPSHTYNSAGSFTATLTVTGSSGQTSSTSQTITVTNAPSPVSASFAANPTSGQAPLTVQFTDQSSGPVSSWSWNFGDGATSTSQNPSYTYSSAGSFTATLTVSGSGGQTSSTSHTITVTNAPSPVSASFAANPTGGEAPLAVQFTDQSSGPVSSWNWNFGDGATSTSQNPSHTYNSAGSFTATLTVRGSSGQTSSTSRTISVTNAPPPPSSTVTVVASQPLATSLTPGIFSITRNGDTSSALTVHYSLGGSAVNGTDYQTLSGSVIIPAGSSTATVTVEPLGLLNVLKTVVLTVSPDSSYTVVSPKSATVTIVASLAL